MSATLARPAIVSLPRTGLAALFLLLGVSEQGTFGARLDRQGVKCQSVKHV